MLVKDGVFIVRESVKSETCSMKGNDGYTSLKLKNFEELMKEVGLFHFKVGELEFKYPKASMPCQKEFYWAIF